MPIDPKDQEAKRKEEAQRKDKEAQQKEKDERSGVKQPASEDQRKQPRPLPDDAGKNVANPDEDEDRSRLPGGQPDIADAPQQPDDTEDMVTTYGEDTDDDEKSLDEVAEKAQTILPGKGEHKDKDQPDDDKGTSPYPTPPDRRSR